MSLDLISRANSANSGTIATLNNNTATTTINRPTTTNTTNTVVNTVKNYNKGETKRINVSFSEEIFDKLITATNGRSVSRLMESIIIDAVRDIEIDEEVVRKYKDKMKNKGKKKATDNSIATTKE